MTHDAAPIAGARMWVTFGGLASATVAIFLLAHLRIFPQPISQLLVVLIGCGWLLALVFYVSRRFGRVGIGSTFVLGAVIAVWFTIRYRQEISQRQFVDAIKRFKHVDVLTTGLESGSLWTGDIHYLYFESGISEPEVLQILRSPGLERLKRVVFKRTHITDRTLAELAVLPGLRDVYLEGGDVTTSGIEKLIARCPDCRLEVRD